MKRLTFPPVIQIIVAIVFFLGVILPVPSADAAPLSDDQFDSAQEVCIHSAESKGYTVDEVISVKPRLGSGTNVVLNLSKNGQRFKFNCGYSESIAELVDKTRVSETVVVPSDDRVKRATAIADQDRDDEVTKAVEQKVAKVLDRNRTARAVAETKTDREIEKAETVEPVVSPKTEREARRTSGPSFPPLLWLLPLLALPLLYFLVKQRNQPTVIETVQTPSSYVQATSVTTIGQSEAVIRNNGVSINIYSGPGITNQVTGNLSDGQRVTLSGRYENNWAELASGGWIDMQYLEKDPRVIA